MRLLNFQFLNLIKVVKKWNIVGNVKEKKYLYLSLTISIFDVSINRQQGGTSFFKYIWMKYICSSSSERLYKWSYANLLRTFVKWTTFDYSLISWSYPPLLTSLSFLDPIPIFSHLISIFFKVSHLLPSSLNLFLIS